MPTAPRRSAPAHVPDFNTLFSAAGGDFHGEDRLLLVFLVADLGRQASAREVRSIVARDMSPADFEERIAELVALGVFEVLEHDGVRGWRITRDAADFLARRIAQRCPPKEWAFLPPWLNSIVRAL